MQAFFQEKSVHHQQKFSFKNDVQKKIQIFSRIFS